MNTNTQEIITSLKSTNAAVIWLPPEPDYQVVAAGLSLFLALKNQQKNVEIICPSEMKVAVNRLVGVNQIKTKLPSQNLVVSFNYVKDAIDKVSYNVDNGKFNLVIQPQAGHEPLSPDNVSYSLSAAPIDLVILVSITSAEGIPPETPTVSLVADNNKTLIGETFQLIDQAQLPLNQDIAGNLLKGLAAETQQFQRATSADFTLAAELTKVGASPTEIEPQPSEPTEKTEAPPPKWSGPKIFRSGEI